MPLSVVSIGVFGALCLLALIEAAPTTRMEGSSSKLYLQVYEAGKREGRYGPKLEDGSSICPDIFPGGFSIACKGVPEGSGLVYLSYNDRYTRVEKREPYTLTGDMHGNAAPLRNPGEGGTVKCWTATGESVQVQITIKCRGSKPMPEMDDMSPEPDMSSGASPGEPPYGEDPPSEEDSMPLEPTMGPISAAGPVMSVEESSNGNKMPDSMADAEMKPETTRKPATTAEKDIMNAEMPELSSGSTDEAPGKSPGKPAKGAKGNCIVLSALRDIDRLAPGWVRRRNGIIFKPNTGGFKIEKVPTSDNAVIRMKFKAPANTRMAVAMDSTSQHGTEANDLFVRMTSPKLILVKNDRVQSGVFMKAFQSSNGRDPKMRCRADVLLPGGKRHGDSITTGMLKEGEEYEFQFAGRSNKFTLHNFVMWPCAGDDCKDGAKAWQEMVEICRPF